MAYVDGPVRLIDLDNPLILSHDDSGDLDVFVEVTPTGDVNFHPPAGGKIQLEGDELLTLSVHQAIATPEGLHVPGVLDDVDPATTYGTVAPTGVYPGLLWIQHATGTPDVITALKVRNAANAGWVTLIAVGVQPITLNNQVDSYTLALVDAEAYVTLTKATAVTCTVPPNADVAFPVGTSIVIEQGGAGGVTITAGAGVTLQSEGGRLITAGQFAAATVTKKATNTWTVSGNVVA